jgi:hypothetical protein
LNLSVNAVTPEADSTKTVALAAILVGATGISPSTLSPVLSQDLTVALKSNYPDITDISLYDAYVLGTTDFTYSRKINIVTFDNTAKTLTVRFNGAPSGDYVVQITGPEGNVGGKMKITTLIEIDSISPTTGSVLGGTLLTI